MTPRSLVITGSTGMIGSTCLKMALEDERVTSITTLTRRPTSVSHSKITELVLEDHADLSSVADALAGIDAALYCMGTYTGIGDAELARTTVDLPVHFAETLFQQSPGATFALLSGQGADRSGKSRIAFARYKGIAESRLAAVGFPRFHTCRPGYIYPVEPRVEPHIGYRLTRMAYPVLKLLYPNMGIASDDLARAMLRIVLAADGEYPEILENRALRKIGRATPTA